MKGRKLAKRERENAKTKQHIIKQTKKTEGKWKIEGKQMKGGKVKDEWRKEKHER